MKHLEIGPVFRCAKELIWYYDESGNTCQLTISMVRNKMSFIQLKDILSFKFHGVFAPLNTQNIDWLNEVIGYDNYMWTSWNQCWFDGPENATMFKLRWG
jgi:hypothetical protein